MVLRGGMLEGFQHSWSRDRARYEGDSDRLEFCRRESFRRVASPEAVSIARHCGESGDAVIAEEIVDFRAFDVCGTVIAAAESGISSPGPRFANASGEILRVGAHIQRGRGVPPNFPGCFRRA